MVRPTRWLLLMVFLVAAAAPLPAQLRPRPIAEETGEVQLQLMFRKLKTSATFMMTDAHPDDENNALLAQMSHGLGLRTVLVTATRGDGGQNEIGPEIFDGLAVLRTEELLQVHRFDGAEQLFTRAVDFGYSFSLDETYEEWGKDEIVGDYVRQIRTIRPDLVVGFLWTGNNGGMHHQASTHITEAAFLAAGDPTKYPEQIKEGLRPWQAKKFYYTGLGVGGGGGGDTATTTNTYDPVLGLTYDEIGSQARTMHKCQNVSQLPALPGGGAGFGRSYHLQDTAPDFPHAAPESSILDGIDIRLTALADYAKPTRPAGLITSLQTITKDVDDAEGAFAAHGLDAAIPGLAAGLHELRSLRTTLGRLGLSDSARFEIDFRLAQKEIQFEEALATASALRVETIGNDPMVVPGQSVRVQVIVANRSHAPVQLTKVDATGFHGSASCQAQTIAASADYVCAANLTIPDDAKATDIYFRHDPSAGARYSFDPGVPFGAPFAPTPFRVAIAMTVGGEPITITQPVEARYEEDKTSGEKRTELLVVPAFALTVSPAVVVAPTGGVASREVRVTVRNDTPAAASATVHLTVPGGWSVQPAAAPVTFAREDEESTVRFTVTSPANAREGKASIGAVAENAGHAYTTGFQIVEYPHIRRGLLAHPAEAEARSVAVKVAPDLRVGYIMGVGDKVPDAITQLGVPVSFIEPDEMAWGDLSKYPVIMVGVRAYERRPDLRANNQRLLDYASAGGTVLLNYQRTEFNQTQGGYGPYPAQTTSNRVTDETAPVKILVPTHPAFTTPNAIGPGTWADWVQERGTYFLAPQSTEYVDLLESKDPFPDNNTPQHGILVDAKVGQGRWMYIGLVLWRELPEGVPGAYQLLANLISLGRKTK
jgi:LmbE family N-acetylglucosaminyl deacetylase